MTASNAVGLAFWILIAVLALTGLLLLIRLILTSLFDIDLGPGEDWWL